MNSTHTDATSSRSCCCFMFYHVLPFTDEAITIKQSRFTMVGWWCRRLVFFARRPLLMPLPPAMLLKLPVRIVGLRLSVGEQLGRCAVRRLLIPVTSWYPHWLDMLMIDLVPKVADLLSCCCKLGLHRIDRPQMENTLIWWLIGIISGAFCGGETVGRPGKKWLANGLQSLLMIDRWL